MRHLRPELFRFITAARDPRGAPLPAGRLDYRWLGRCRRRAARLELLDEVVDALDDEPTRELAAAVAIVGGEGPARRPRASARRRWRRRPRARAIGRALLGSPDDKAFFAELGNSPDQITARHIHTALTARGPKQRRGALDELSAGVADAAAPFGAERLLALTLAIGDRRPDVAERAAAALAAYAETDRAAPRRLHHALFIERADEVVARGVTEAALRYLETVRASIPGAAPLGAAQIVVPPPTLTPTARARVKEMLESLGVTLAPIAGDPSTERRDPALEAAIAANPTTARPTSSTPTGCRAWVTRAARGSRSTPRAASPRARREGVPRRASRHPARPARAVRRPRD